MGINWTDEIIEKLTEHRNEGLSASESCAKLTVEFGVEFTRNMVIAKRHRMGMTSRDDERRHKSRRAALMRHAKKRAETGAPEPKRVRKPNSFTVTSSLTGLFVPGRELPRAPMPVEDTPPVDLVKFADLTQSSCRWIYGDTRDPSHGYCGKQVVPGLSWCALHKSRVFQPPQPRVRRPAVERVPTIADLEKV